MKRILPFVVAAAALSILGAVAAVAPRPDAGTPHERIMHAAKALVQSFPEADRAKLTLAFDDRARTDWHFVPRSRPGVRMADMSNAQKLAARDLLRAALSSQGVLKVEQIMSLDGVLREMENNPGRDPLQYTFTIYGEPSASGAWGWKVEGHHISLNFTCVKGQVSAVTPSFLGANPATVPSGALAGMRPLAVEEDLARELLRSLDDGQRAEAVIADTAPADILLIPGRAFDVAPPAGIAYAKLNAAQRRMMDDLLDEYAHTLRRELAHAELERLRAGGMDEIRFAWAGSAESGKGHYYRITGPTFVIEYDNIQNNANHVHTVWHDRTRNFGADALREHYRHEHGTK